MNRLLSSLREAWSNFSSRERILVAGAGSLLLFFLLYFALALPLVRATQTSQVRATAAEQEFQVTLRLQKQFSRIHQRLQQVEDRIRDHPGGNIVTTLETLARQSSISVNSMTPRVSAPSERYQETKVEVSLKGIQLKQMVDYLDRIERSKEFLSVKTLRVLTRTDKPGLLDITFTVSAFEPI